MFASLLGRPARLFHASDLRDGGVVDETIRGNTQVVGVVLNTVDDELDGAMQSTQSWTVARFSHLESLLGAASDAGRVVVLASDHGHVLDRGAGVVKGLRARAGDEETERRRGGARWRVAPPEPAPGEHVVRAPWLQAALGVDAVVVPSAEGLRYGMPARGYHGGVARAELVAPLVVLGTEALTAKAAAAASLMLLEAPAPAWHAPPIGAGGADVGAHTQRAVAAPAGAAGAHDARAGALGVAGQVRLAPRGAAPAGTAQPPAPDSAAPTAAAPTAAAALPSHPRWPLQRRRPGSSEQALPDAMAVRLVDLALANGGRLAAAQASTALGEPMRRIPSRFDALCELLNVDGTPVAVHERGEAMLRVDAARLWVEWG
jgi:hypothetical protein